MSFILRKILEDGQQVNISLGDRYNLIDREKSYEEFKIVYEKHFETLHVADLDSTSDSFSKNCYGLISTDGGHELIPLYKHHFNYVMTDTGKTFANLTHK